MAKRLSKWEEYEETAVFLLDQIATVLGLERVEGKQALTGENTRWAVDGKGVTLGGEGFIIIECRRRTKSKQKQEDVGALAYRIKDTGASGGIMVSPLGLQEGAAKVAAAENIQTVYMDENSTSTDYLLRFLNQAFVGMSDTATAKDELTVEKFDGVVESPL